MRDFVADTHALLWHLYDPAKLGSAAREVFAEADAGDKRIYIPAVVVAEALMVAEKRRITGLSVELLLPHIQAARFSENYVLADLHASSVLESHRLTAIPDIFDRLIVAEALSRGIALLTRDPIIRQSGLIQTVWD